MRIKTNCDRVGCPLQFVIRTDVCMAKPPGLAVLNGSGGGCYHGYAYELRRSQW